MLVMKIGYYSVLMQMLVMLLSWLGRIDQRLDLLPQLRNRALSPGRGEERLSEQAAPSGSQVQKACWLSCARRGSLLQCCLG